MAKATRQRGFVSILTVLFFMTLVSVITISFTRFMIQERRQELQDELTKSAYNAALSGVEDAKQAMAYCSASWLSDTDRAQCETALYNPSCPGFNASSYFESVGIIKRSDNGKTSITGESSATAPQGYSCVIVQRDTSSLEGQAKALSSSGAMFELHTTTPYHTIRIYWEQKGASGLPGTLSLNPRVVDWDASWPAALRLSIISVSNPASFSLSDISQKTTFVYPTSTGSTTAVVKPLGTPADMPSRTATRCDNNPSMYRCYIDIKFDISQTGNQYVVLNSLYKNTNYSIAAYADINPTASSIPLLFNGVQPRIDSTGYTSGLSRRVVANVHPGGPALNIANAIDSGFALCKDFRVGVTADIFTDLVHDRCSP